MKEKTILGGSVVAAFAASLCCITPLLFVLLGVGSLGAAATIFETARPYMMVGAVLLLAIAYYRIYFKRETECAPGESCAVKPGRPTARIGLWLATIAVMLFAMLPYATATLAARLTSKPEITPVEVFQSDDDCCIKDKAANQTAATEPNAVLAANLARVTFTVTGMTCASCETAIKLALDKTPGVKRATVSYSQSNAVVDYDPKVTTPSKLRDAINETGYKVKE